MHYVGISTYHFIPYYASATQAHTRNLKPFKDSEPTGLKVLIAEGSGGGGGGDVKGRRQTDIRWL